MANILETIQNNDILKVLVVILGIYLIYTYYFKPQEKYGSYYGMIPEQLENVQQEMTLAQPESLSVEAPIAQMQQEQIDKIVAEQQLVIPLSTKTVVYDIAKNIHITEVANGVSAANRFDNFNLWYIKTRR